MRKYNVCSLHNPQICPLFFLSYHGPQSVFLHTLCLIRYHAYYIVLLNPPLILPDFTIWFKNLFINSSSQNTIFPLIKFFLKFHLLSLSDSLDKFWLFHKFSSDSYPGSFLFYLYTLTELDQMLVTPSTFYICMCICIYIYIPWHFEPDNSLIICCGQPTVLSTDERLTASLASIY